MNNQITISKNLSPLKSILSLYFFTLGTCLLGFSTYLFLESLNITSEPITSWSGQSWFWSFILFFVALLVIFLPVEFTGSYNLVNSSFRDLIVNVTITILVSLFFLIFFQIVLPNQNAVFLEMISLTRAISFSGFVVLPVVIFILNNLEQKYSKLNRFTFSISLLFWILASQFFL